MLISVTYVLTIINKSKFAAAMATPGLCHVRPSHGSLPNLFAKTSNKPASGSEAESRLEEEPVLQAVKGRPPSCALSVERVAGQSVKNASLDTDNSANIVEFPAARSLCEGE